MSVKMRRIKTMTPAGGTPWVAVDGVPFADCVNWPSPEKAIEDTRSVFDWADTLPKKMALGYLGAIGPLPVGALINLMLPKATRDPQFALAWAVLWLAFASPGQLLGAVRDNTLTFLVIERAAQALSKQLEEK